MSTTDYTKDLDTLKTSLNQLNKEELDLSSAMQTYQQGLKQHERCVNTLTTLEQSIENNEWTVEPVELKLEDIFTSLENIEQPIEELPETNLESCIELLIQAEHLVHAGYQKLDLATDALTSSVEKNIASKIGSGIDEVHRV